jgi:hypothetical protein
MKFRWDIVVLVLSIYNAIIIPFYQAFENEELKEGINVLLNIVVDFVFLADIILGFFTSVVTSREGESYNS